MSGKGQPVSPCCPFADVLILLAIFKSLFKFKKKRDGETPNTLLRHWGLRKWSGVKVFYKVKYDEVSRDTDGGASIYTAKRE